MTIDGLARGGNEAALGSGAFRPLRAYLDGGRPEAGWQGGVGDPILPKNVAAEPVNFEDAARRACAEFLNADVTSSVFPHARPTRSIRVFLEEVGSVIATRRGSAGRAELDELLPWLDLRADSPG